jgi:hypothetical protein
MADIKISGRSVQELIDEEAISLVAVKTSDLENDVGYVTVNDTVANSNTADSATGLVTPSGVQASSYGPTANVNIAQGGKTGSIDIPYFTVNAQGIITSMTTHKLTVTTGCNNCNVIVPYSRCSRCGTNCSHCSESP